MGDLEKPKTRVWMGGVSEMDLYLWGRRITDELGNKVRVMSAVSSLGQLKDNVFFGKVGPEDVVLVGVGGQMDWTEQVETKVVADMIIRSGKPGRVGLIHDGREENRKIVGEVRQKIDRGEKIAAVDGSLRGMIKGRMAKEVKALVSKKRK